MKISEEFKELATRATKIYLSKASLTDKKDLIFSDEIIGKFNSIGYTFNATNDIHEFYEELKEYKQGLKSFKPGLFQDRAFAFNLSFNE